MQLEQFKQSLNAKMPPEDLHQSLKALWYDAQGDWNTAHHVVQDSHDRAGAWVHAYLHRKEGELGNAGYWYIQAGKTMAVGSVEQEGEVILRTLLQELSH